MTRRHDNLLPLTHDHHHALRNARMLRLAAERDRPARIEAVEGFLRFLRTEAVAHFRDEEEVIFPLVALHEDAPTTGIQRLLSEHVVMHALVRELDEKWKAGDPTGETMLTLADISRPMCGSKRTSSSRRSSNWCRTG